MITALHCQPSQSFDSFHRLRRRLISTSQWRQKFLGHGVDHFALRDDGFRKGRPCFAGEDLQMVLGSDQGNFPGSVFSEAGEFQDAIREHDAALGIAFDFRAMGESQVDIILLKFARQQAGRSLLFECSTEMSHRIHPQYGFFQRHEERSFISGIKTLSDLGRNRQAIFGVQDQIVRARKERCPFQALNSNPFHPFGWDYITYRGKLRQVSPPIKISKIVKLFADARKELENQIKTFLIRLESVSG